MGEMVASALAQEGVSRVSSFISTKLGDRASRADNLARLEWAVYRLELALEKTAKMPITYVSLLRGRKMLKSAYMEGADLLSKHKQHVPEGHAETGQLVVTSRPSYLERIIAGAANFSLSSLAGLKYKQRRLSSSVVQKFERYADCADKFVADVESACPLRRDITFRYPFVRQLLQGKYLSYQRVEGSQRLWFSIWPVVLEGRGVESWLSYDYFDLERLDRSFSLELMLRLSESTYIVGAAIDCLRSSASLLKIVPQDAIMAELTCCLPNLQDISDSYAPPWVGFEDWHAFLSKWDRQDPLCCQRNGHEPCVRRTNSSELSHMLQEQTISFHFSCYVSALEYSLPCASDEVGRNIMIDRTPLKLTVGFQPHFSCPANWVTEYMGGISEKGEYHPFGSIQQTVDMIRSRSVVCLVRQPEVEDYDVYWVSEHGSASFSVSMPRIRMAGAHKASGKYHTRSAAKRKRR